MMVAAMMDTIDVFGWSWRSVFFVDIPGGTVLADRRRQVRA